MAANRQELRAQGSFTATGSSNGGEVIFPPVIQNVSLWEIIEIVAQPSVDTANLGIPVTLQLVTGQPNQYQAVTPPWDVFGGGTLSDSGFILNGGQNIVLLWTNGDANNRRISWLIRYRQYVCQEADTAIRRSLT